MDFLLDNSTLKLRYKYYYKNFKNITAEIGKKRLDRRHTVQATMINPLTDYLVAESNVKFIRALSS